MKMDSPVFKEASQLFNKPVTTPHRQRRTVQHTAWRAPDSVQSALGPESGVFLSSHGQQIFNLDTSLTAQWQSVASAVHRCFHSVWRTPDSGLLSILRVGIFLYRLCRESARPAPGKDDSLLGEVELLGGEAGSGPGLTL